MSKKWIFRTTLAALIALAATSSIHACPPAKPQPTAAESQGRSTLVINLDLLFGSPALQLRQAPGDTSFDFDVELTFGSEILSDLFQQLQEALLCTPPALRAPVEEEPRQTYRDMLRLTQPLDLAPTGPQDKVPF